MFCFCLFRNKYLLLNSQELNELSAISMKANIPEVEALVNTDRSLVCDGKKGLLTRILTVMKREPPDSSFRYASHGAQTTASGIKQPIQGETVLYCCV